ncbi:hypothetical protein G7Y89_g9116 [Cudoniella acicularis]|uniref:Fungal N-terminal domain-containing protein n=1 Tax=Cudoniella acicularis TaxID=354080 RepID=A0A8H4RHL2_9HELO|nr:hypothetical protein G7Y89_g9116 [Cudoniella acicularis]
MLAGFGFSVGDFIAGIQLVRDVITSLKVSGGSSVEYQALMTELFSLERALLDVKTLRSLDSYPDQLDALKCATTQCQHTINRFMTKIQKYQPTLNAQGSSSKWRGGFRKVQCISNISVVANKSRGITLEWPRTSQNQQKYYSFLEIQKFITALLAQVLRQQPICFTDAHGLEVPFHLEFMYSAEVTLFYPGMKVAMDIVYNAHIHSSLARSTCPGYGLHSTTTDERTICRNCGIYCHRPPLPFATKSQPSPTNSRLVSDPAEMTTNMKPGYIRAAALSKPTKAIPPSRKRLNGDTTLLSQDVARFRRIRIEFPKTFTPPPPIIPSWLTKSVENLQLKYPDDRFHPLMVFSTINVSNEGMRTVARDPPWPPGHGGSLGFLEADDEDYGHVIYWKEHLGRAKQQAKDEENSDSGASNYILKS